MSDPRKSSRSPVDAPSSSRRPPPASQQSMRPLAPKPLAPSQPASISSSTPVSSQSSGSKRQGPGPCPVCYRVGCQLVTHTAYTAHSQSSGSSSPTKPSVDPAFTSSYAYVLAQQYTGQRGLPTEADTRYELPLDPERNNPEMRRLFHAWFMIESQKSVRITRPPELAGDLVYAPFLMPAMQDPLLCLSILAVSSAALTGRSIPLSSNVTSLTLVGETIQRMRERVDSDPSHIADSTIATAVFLWLANIFLQDTAAMASHSSSVYAFVETRGGLHKLGLSGAVEQLIRWVDIFHSFILAVPCHYLDPRDPGPLTKAPEARYGSYWDRAKQSPSAKFPAPVTTACHDTCRLFEVLEQGERDGASTAWYYYVWQRLCVLCTRESTLRARSRAYGHVNECVCMAIGILKWICLFRLDTLAVASVEKLVTAIKATGGPPVWQKDLDLLIWLLFTVAVVPVEFETKSWSLSVLSHAVASRFGTEGILNEHWKDDLRRCLRSFVWCDLRLEQSFQQICRAIQKELDEDDGSDDDDDDDDDDDETGKGKARAAA